MPTFLTQRSVAMQTTVWVLGILLALPGQGFETCTCLLALENVCNTCALAAETDSPQTCHTVIAQHHGDKCPCQCHHNAPQQPSLIPRDSRTTDDADQIVRLAACLNPTRWAAASQSLFAVHARMQPALPVLLRCATLSRFLL